MLVDQLAGSRRRQVLQALNDNGPLSISVLAAVVRPPMAIKSLRKVVRRLRGKRILTTHFESLSHSSGHFYRISHDRIAREQVAKWLRVPSEELRQPKFFSKELQHSTQCALWVAYLRDEYPDAEIVRDLQMLKRRTYLRNSKSVESDRDSVPDIVLTFRGELVRDSVSIALEIERTRKSDKRLALKLNKLVNQSVLDGVVYICETGGIRDAISAVLKDRQFLNSPRIRHYGAAFLLFADRTALSAGVQPVLYNVEGKLLHLRDWVTALRLTSADYRRESHFLNKAIAEPRGAAIAEQVE